MQTWVFAEEMDGAPGSLALEMLTKARSFGGDLAAVYVGAGSPEAFEALGAHGAATVFHIDPGESLPSAGIAVALAGLIEERSPDLLLFGMGYTDRDVAGRLSARIDRPVLSNAVEITVDGDGVVVTNEILGGTTLVDARFESPAPWIAVVRPKSFVAEPGEPATPEVIEVALGDAGHAGAATIAERHTEAAEGPDLEEAELIVTGGRGMGSEEAFGILGEIARSLGGAVGATRAVVDTGWVPYSLQIGQTGKTVKPGVYLAAGVSGAMQHAVGMKDSGIIIAINKDEEAPIFGISDLGIVGDVHKVLPKLLEELQSRG
jgi:electron transfer flavoprotein alpha subunit